MNYEYHDSKLIVDGAYSVLQLPAAYIIVIGSERFILRDNAKAPIDPAKLSRYIPQLSDSAMPIGEYMYPVLGIYPRAGHNVKLGRAATKDEIEAIIVRYDLTDDDISEPFEDSKGAFYGKDAIKRFTSIQIRVPVEEAITLEQTLIRKGIEAANASAGRVNIRVS